MKELRVSAAKEKEILSRKIRWHIVLKEIRKGIDASPEARKALACLVQDGCDKEMILKSLCLYCGGTPSDAAIIKQLYTIVGFI